MTVLVPSYSLRRALCRVVVGLAGLLMLNSPAAAIAGDAAAATVVELQREWEQVRYQTPAAQRVQGFEALAAKAHQASQTHSGRSEPLVWEGIIISSLAGAKGGAGALSLVKQARDLYEAAIRIDGKVLEGAAYSNLGVLFYKVPAWPIGFGDKDKARELLRKALEISPTGIDSNYFYGDFLVEMGKPDEAVGYLKRVLQAPSRPGRELSDRARRDEAQAQLSKLGK